ncbi:hypothetical protein NHX12_020262 [Muraenolepis orangiensis]|uniref:Uncharacterized protein n=1 Tax=Muraenolepis orangiensis TaxID=630683 RepID=A0A9Q0IW47_9TELE|nr:hypothetical protein NHX12_020262 [Muraenolepis orangiensis]
MYCAPAKASKAARSVRAQRHTDVPRAAKAGTAAAGHQGDRGKERRMASQQQQQPDKAKQKPWALLALLLFSQICGASASFTVPAAGSYDNDNNDDSGLTDWESLNALVEDEVGSQLTSGAIAAAVGPQNRRGYAPDNTVPRIYIVSDMGFQRHQTQSPDRAVSRRLPALTDPNIGDLGVRLDRRDSNNDGKHRCGRQ